MRVLCLDVGTARIGIALSDEDGVIAQPYSTLAMDRELKKTADAIGKLCGELEIETVVIGLPLSQGGGDRGVSARLAMRLGEAIEAAAEVKVAFWDERFSTAEAERLLVSAGASRKKRRAVTDKVAAALILQGYLDAQARHGSTRQ